MTFDLSPEVCVIRELFVLDHENFIFLRFFQQELIQTGQKRVCPWTPWRQWHYRLGQSSELDRSSSLTSCSAGLGTVSDL